MNMVGEVNVDIYMHCQKSGALPLRDFKIQACCVGDILEYESDRMRCEFTSEIYSGTEEIHNYPPEAVECSAYEVVPTREIWSVK